MCLIYLKSRTHTAGPILDQCFIHLPCIFIHLEWQILRDPLLNIDRRATLLLYSSWVSKDHEYIYK